jgi:hypothetical protein
MQNPTSQDIWFLLMQSAFMKRQGCCATLPQIYANPIIFSASEASFQTLAE